MDEGKYIFLKKRRGFITNSLLPGRKRFFYIIKGIGFPQAGSASFTIMSTKRVSFTGFIDILSFRAETKANI